MEESKEIGYVIISLLNYSMPGFVKLWNNTDAVDRDIMVRVLGERVLRYKKQLNKQ